MFLHRLHFNSILPLKYLVTRDDLYASLNDYQEMSEYMMDVAASRVERAAQLATHELVAHRIPIDPEDEEAHIMFKEQWQERPFFF